MKLFKAALPSIQTPSDRDFRAFIRARLRAMAEITGKLGDGKLTPREWADLIDKELLKGHGGSWTLGRQLGGDLRPENFFDTQFGMVYKDRQAEFLLNFMEQLDAGDVRYYLDDGSLNEIAVNARLRLYGGAMRGTANIAFVEAGTVLDEYEWRLGSAEEHCGACPELAAMSPWTKDTLYAYPGDGTTPCLGNCTCHLVRSDGVSTFSRPY